MMLNPPADPEMMSPAVMANAATEIDNILDHEPDFGFGVFDHMRKTLEQYDEDLRRNRADIRQPKSLAAFYQDPRVAEPATQNRQPSINPDQATASSTPLNAISDTSPNGVFVAAAIARRVPRGPHRQLAERVAELVTHWAIETPA